MEQAVYRLLTLNKNAAMSAFKLLRRIKGLKCVIRKPALDTQPYRQYEEGRRGSIFGQEDLVDYENWETYNDKLLIFNLFKEGYAGWEDYDTFGGDIFCLTPTEEKLPIHTEIEIDMYGKHMTYRVDEHMTLSPTVVDQLFIKHKLVPAT